VTRAAGVVIGCNEGPRLPRCLRSVLARFDPVVYVDSASTDGSVDTARALGAVVVALDLSIPFTCGRARNVGAARVLELAPDVAYIQFVDADSEVVATWLGDALAALSQSPAAGAIHGRVRERGGGGPLYDRLYELEFDPRSEADDVFGGMAMLRVTAFVAVGRYRETMQAFEDHELSFRMRRAGWQIRRLDTDMVVHEAGMTRGREWWAREWRAGHGRAQLMAMHAGAGAAEWRRAHVSIWFWGALVPVLTALTALRWGWSALWLALAYVGLLYRIFRRLRRRGFGAGDAALYAAGRVAGKFPQLHGALCFWRERRGAG